MKKKLPIAFGYYFAGIVLSLFIFFRFHIGTHWNFRIPFQYGGDILAVQYYLKELISGASWPFLVPKYLNSGAPFGANFGDYPSTDYSHWLILKFLSFFIKDSGYLLNFYYLLGFVLSTLTFQWAAKRLGMSRPFALVCGLIFSFIPFHLTRFSHLFITSYFMIAPMLVLTLRLWKESPKLGLFSQGRPHWGWLVFIFLFSGSGIYSVFFVCFLLAVSGVSASLSRRRFLPALKASGLIGLIVAALLVCTSPYLIHKYQAGANLSVAHRVASEAQTYGLSAMNISLPSPWHRVHWLANLRSGYRPAYDSVEGNQEYIGTTALLGLFILCLSFLGTTASTSLLTQLSIIAISCFGLATIGGLGAAFAHFVSPMIRCYNRMSVILALVGILAFGLTLSNLLKRLNLSQGWHVALATLCLGWGIFDQARCLFQDTYESIRSAYLSDENFFRGIESKLPARSAVLQLPYLAFPESPPIEKLEDYSHFRAPLHTQTLRWSYGAMRGRPESEQIENVSREPLSLTKITVLGYSAIYVDRRGYKDRGQNIESQIMKMNSHLLGVSPNGDLAVYSISAEATKDN